MNQAFRLAFGRTIWKGNHNHDLDFSLITTHAEYLGWLFPRRITIYAARCGG
ncbi:MAG TPA: hypothetical protein VG326_05240 [Tepidisphaeraceae bacterium]|jgi:hypothetical protein|nr:hypothetical protein [Tepidisphaeraceae bacterium]